MRWLNYAAERSLYGQFISLTPCASACPFPPSLYVSLFFPEPHFQSPTLSNHSSTSTLPACPLCHSLCLLSFIFYFSPRSPSLFPLSFCRPPGTFSFGGRASRAVGLYLVWPMIKSAGLTSASDRPIHPTDTPPPPHTGRLNNLCTISNMKEDLLTLQSPPAPFPISLDC